MLPGGWHWLLTAVYGSLNASVGKHIWDMWVEGPWMLVGDFNCVIRGDERSSGTGASYSFVE